MKKKLLIDLDGVLVDFCRAFTWTASQLDPTQKVITTLEQPTWYLKGVMSPKLVEATWAEIRRQPTWWLWMVPLMSHEENKTLKWYARNHEVVYCTSRNARNPADPPISQQSIEWLEKFGLKHPSLVVSKRKGEVAKAIGATHSLDDRPENAAMIHWLTEGACKSYIMDRPYNREVQLPRGVGRVKSLAEFFEEVG